MGILIFGIAIILLLSKEIFFKNDSQKANRDFLIFAGILLVAFFGCRNATINLGSDLNNYYRLFDRAITLESFKDFSATSTMEVGYLWLNWLIARVIKWPQFIIFFQAAFCIGVTLRFIYKYSEDVLLSVLGFMSFGLMQFYLTGFRQSFAIAICLIALEFALKKKFIGFISSVLIAASIHQTAIVFVPVYWIVKIGLTKFYALVDLIVIFILSQGVPRIISLGNEVFDKEYQGAFGGNRLGGMINILIGIGVLAVMFYQSDRYKKPEISEKSINNSIQPLSGLFHLTAIGTGVYALRYQALVLERISLYFTPGLFILLPHIINNSFTEDSKKILKPLFVFAMVFLAWWRLHNYSYEVFW